MVSSCCTIAESRQKGVCQVSSMFGGGVRDEVAMADGSPVREVSPLEGPEKATPLFHGRTRGNRCG